jgi:hypothetical protein
MKLRQRFLTKEEKAAHQALQERKRLEDMVKARRESRLQKAKEKRLRELKKRRANELMKDSLEKCELGFRLKVKAWAKEQSVAKVNNFFRLLEEFKCPMEPCYNMNKLEPSQKLLRLNKCGYKELNYGLYLYDIVDWEWEWGTKHKQKCDRAHELDSLLYSVSRY